MRRFIADFHVHTLLSPCAEIEMTPRNIVRHAVQFGIDIVAITDHNACDNVTAALDAAIGTNVAVIPGMEVESKEEAHILVLFEKMRQLKEWESYVNANRQDRSNNAEKFGAQFIVDSDDNFIAEKKEMLLGSLTVGVVDIIDKANSMGAICIASHVDKPTYSIISQLGFIPPDAKLAAIEISKRMTAQKARQMFRSIGGLAVLTNSDAHMMSDFIEGPKTRLDLEEATFNEIRQALASENLRRVVE